MMYPPLKEQCTLGCVVIIAGMLAENCKHPVYGDSFWIGGQRTASGTSYVWSHRSPMVYSYWSPGEPNNVGPACVKIASATGYRWTDDSCTTSSCFLCEI